MIAELLRFLTEATLATSAAALVVLLLRRSLIARLGASIGYAAWVLVPVAALAVLLPSERSAERMMVLRETLAATGSDAASPAAPGWTITEVALLVWFAGACAMAVCLWLQQSSFRRTLRGAQRRTDGLLQAPASAGLPAVVGMIRPRIVLPADFDARYDAAERELILCHERIHIRRFDLQANALAALLRALFWFNPLLHFAATRFRRDQELACDERVIARHPHQRRRYADAMLKTHMAGSPLPIGCHWQDATPLKERIAMLKLHAPGMKRSFIGAALLTMLSALGGFAAWAAQPEREIESGQQAYLVLITQNINDETRRFEIREAADTPFSLAVDSGGHRYEGRFRVRDLGADQFLFNADLSVDGAVVAKPAIVGLLGKPVSIESGDEEDEKQKLTIVVTKSPGDQQASVSVAKLPDTPKPGQYPVAAATQGVGGMVKLQLGIAEDGSLTKITVVQSEPAGLFDEAAVRMAKDMKFNPRIVDGRPVPHGVVMPFRFDAAPSPPVAAPAL